MQKREDVLIKLPALHQQEVEADAIEHGAFTSSSTKANTLQWINAFCLQTYPVL
jgi:hypothetical protein